MNIEGYLILAAMGGLVSAIVAMASVVVVLWVRSEKCLTERQSTAKELAILQNQFLRLLGRLSSCSVTACPFREWSQDELDDDVAPVTSTHSTQPEAVKVHPLP